MSQYGGSAAALNRQSDPIETLSLDVIFLVIFVKLFQCHITLISPSDTFAFWH